MDALCGSEYASGPNVLRPAWRASWRNPPVVEPKGLPEDMSEMTQYCYQMSEEDNYNVHHQGWLSSDELWQLQQKLWDMNPTADRWEYDLEEEYFHCYIRGNAVSSHQGFDDSRLIFWFVN